MGRGKPLKKARKETWFGFASSMRKWRQDNGYLRINQNNRIRKTFKRRCI